MATQVQLRRGTSAENDAFTGAIGEVTVDTTNNTLRVHDGTTAGGFSVASGSTTASKDLDNLSSTGKANVSAQGTYDSGATYNAGTIGKAIQGKANVDMDNLTSTGANITNWSKNVSNCIVEIPQDINITLVNGVLTVKAGTKAYKPDGSSFTTTNDTVVPLAGGTNTKYFIFVDSSTTVAIAQVQTCYSGNSAPTFSGTAIWYDTANNIIKYSGDSGATWSNTSNSLPIAIATPGATEWTSLDQVFNGFGYIGSTVFALPGVKALAAAGRNSNGSLNSVLVTLGSVKTVSSNLTRSGKLGIQSSGSLFFFIDYSYDEVKNRIYNYGLQTACCAGDLVYNAGRVESLTPKTVFHAVDYNDREYIAHQAMPSDRYTVLTVPTSGQTVTAPADGYLSFGLAVSNVGEGISLLNASTNIGVESHPSSTTNAKALLLVSKGDVISVYYTGSGTKVFRFIYANGTK